uniref:(California timema) hypothetical protein n=1 Tax=Timema californicum TaxID=61474 RepID=A0A7R9J1L1_TIMCA|nr:unnamed protein product [Timema californicum]
MVMCKLTYVWFSNKIKRVFLCIFSNYFNANNFTHLLYIPYNTDFSMGNSFEIIELFKHCACERRLTYIRTHSNKNQNQRNNEKTQLK